MKFFSACNILHQSFFATTLEIFVGKGREVELNPLISNILQRINGIFC